MAEGAYERCKLGQFDLCHCHNRCFFKAFHQVVTQLGVMRLKIKTLLLLHLSKGSVVCLLFGTDALVRVREINVALTSNGLETRSIKQTDQRIDDFHNDLHFRALVFICCEPDRLVLRFLIVLRPGCHKESLYLNKQLKLRKNLQSFDSKGRVFVAVGLHLELALELLDVVSELFFLLV